MKLYKELSLTDENIKYLSERKKFLKSFLSESIHSSFNASFSSYTMMTLDYEIDDNIYGKITIGFPRLLTSLIEELFIFNNLFKKAIDNKISLELENVTELSASTLYLYYNEKYNTLCEIYFEKIEKEAQSYNDFINDVKKAFENYNDA